MIHCQNKAPAFANVDNIEEKLQKHYGKYYSKPEDFIKILKQEEEMPIPGEKITQIQDEERTL